MIIRKYIETIYNNKYLLNFNEMEKVKLCTLKNKYQSTTVLYIIIMETCKISHMFD